MPVSCDRCSSIPICPPPHSPNTQTNDIFSSRMAETEPKIVEVPDESGSDDSDDDMPELEAAAAANGEAEVPGEGAAGDANRSRSENKVRVLKVGVSDPVSSLVWSARRFKDTA